MRKRKPDKQLKVSKRFLQDLLIPFNKIGEISDVADNGDSILIYYKEGGVEDTS